MNTMRRPDSLPLVEVEYDSKGKRATKLFQNAYLARRFYEAKAKQGKNPKVKKAGG